MGCHLNLRHIRSPLNPTEFNPVCGISPRFSKISSKFPQNLRMIYEFKVLSRHTHLAKLWENGRFSGRIWPDWGNTTRADLAGLGSIGIYTATYYLLCFLVLKHVG